MVFIALHLIVRELKTIAGLASKVYDAYKTTLGTDDMCTELVRKAARIQELCNTLSAVCKKHSDVHSVKVPADLPPRIADTLRKITGFVEERADASSRMLGRALQVAQSAKHKKAAQRFSESADKLVDELSVGYQEVSLLLQASAREAAELERQKQDAQHEELMAQWEEARQELAAHREEDREFIVMGWRKVISEVLDERDAAATTATRLTPSENALQYIKRMTEHIPELAATPSSVTLGKGGQAAVFAGKWDELDVACKQLLASDSSEARHLAREAVLTHTCAHYQIIPVYGWCRMPEGAYAMVLPIMMGGSLHDQLFNFTRVEERCLLMARKVAAALAYVHTLLPSQRIAHGDVKSMNVLMGAEPDFLGEDGRDVRLTDFGIARAKTGLTQVHTMQQGDQFTMRWAPPELFRLDKFVPDFDDDDDSDSSSSSDGALAEQDLQQRVEASVASALRLSDRDRAQAGDVWAFGCLLLELSSAMLPWGHMTADQVKGSLSEGHRPQLPAQFKRVYSKEWRKLIRKCHEIEPACRPTMAAIFQELDELCKAQDAESEAQLAALKADPGTERQALCKAAMCALRSGSSALRQRGLELIVWSLAERRAQPVLVELLAGPEYATALPTLVQLSMMGGTEESVHAMQVLTAVFSASPTLCNRVVMMKGMNAFVQALKLSNNVRRKNAAMTALQAALQASPDQVPGIAGQIVGDLVATLRACVDYVQAAYKEAGAAESDDVELDPASAAQQRLAESVTGLLQLLLPELPEDLLARHLGAVDDALGQMARAASGLHACIACMAAGLSKHPRGASLAATHINTSVRMMRSRVCSPGFLSAPLAKQVILLKAMLQLMDNVEDDGSLAQLGERQLSNCQTAQQATAVVASWCTVSTVHPHVWRRLVRQAALEQAVQCAVQFKSAALCIAVIDLVLRGPVEWTVKDDLPVMSALASEACEVGADPAWEGLVVALMQRRPVTAPIPHWLATRADAMSESGRAAEQQQLVAAAMQQLVARSGLGVLGDSLLHSLLATLATKVGGPAPRAMQQLWASLLHALGSSSADRMDELLRTTGWQTPTTDAEWKQRLDAAVSPGEQMAIVAVPLARGHALPLSVVRHFSQSSAMSAAAEFSGPGVMLLAEIAHMPDAEPAQLASAARLLGGMAAHSGSAPVLRLAALAELLRIAVKLDAVRVLRLTGSLAHTSERAADGMVHAFCEGLSKALVHALPLADAAVEFRAVKGTIAARVSTALVPHVVVIDQLVQLCVLLQPDSKLLPGAAREMRKMLSSLLGPAWLARAADSCPLHGLRMLCNVTAVATPDTSTQVILSADSHLQTRGLALLQLITGNPWPDVPASHSGNPQASDPVMLVHGLMRQSQPLRMATLRTVQLAVVQCFDLAMSLPSSLWSEVLALPQLRASGGDSAHNLAAVHIAATASQSQGEAVAMLAERARAVDWDSPIAALCMARIMQSIVRRQQIQEFARMLVKLMELPLPGAIAARFAELLPAELWIKAASMVVLQVATSSLKTAEFEERGALCCFTVAMQLMQPRARIAACRNMLNGSMEGTAMQAARGVSLSLRVVTQELAPHEQADVQTEQGRAQLIRVVTGLGPQLDVCLPFLSLYLQSVYEQSKHPSSAEVCKAGAELFQAAPSSVVASVIMDMCVQALPASGDGGVVVHDAANAAALAAMWTPCIKELFNGHQLPRRIAALRTLHMIVLRVDTGSISEFVTMADLALLHTMAISADVCNAMAREVCEKLRARDSTAEKMLSDWHL